MFKNFASIFPQSGIKKRGKKKLIIQKMFSPLRVSRLLFDCFPKFKCMANRTIKIVLMRRINVSVSVNTIIITAEKKLRYILCSNFKMFIPLLQFNIFSSRK